MYNFLIASGSRMRNIIGSDNYDNHWNDLMNRVSNDNYTDFSGSQLVEAELFLQNWEANPSSGSAWFTQLLDENNGNFK